MDYKEKFKDPRWQKKRLEVLERDEWECRICRDKDNTLHVHHLYYERGKEPWEYNNDALVALCADCHEEETNTLKPICDSLIHAIKKQGFFSSQISDIAIGFYTIKTSCDRNILSEAIGWFLSNKDMVDGLVESYLSHKRISSNS